MSVNTFAVRGPQGDLADLLKQVAPFTAASTGLPVHYSNIMLEATDKGVYATAESPTCSAIFRAAKGVEVVEPGKLVVRAASTTRVLGAVRPDRTPLLTHETGSSVVNIEVEGGVHGAFSLPAASQFVPSVHEHTENGIVVDPEALSDVFRAVTTSRDFTGKYPMFGGVFARLDGKKWRMIATNGRGATMLHALPVDEVLGEGLPAMILSPELFNKALSLVGRGSKISLMADTDPSGRFLHMIARTDEGDLIAHARIATLEHNAGEYPVDKILGSINNLVSLLGPQLMVDKADLLYIVRSAEDFTAEDVTILNGQSKDIPVTVADGKLSVVVHDDGLNVDRYNDWLDLIQSKGHVWDAATEVQFILRWGLYSGIIDQYPDAKEMAMGVLMKGDKPLGLALYLPSQTESGVLEADKVPDYLAIIQVTQAKS